jgi:tRNA A37 threonylcarbamoyladenosine dehydratase
MPDRECVVPEELSRTAMVLTAEKVSGLKTKRVAVFGVGGVGGYVCEALCRTGIGGFDLIDMDTVSLSNINRQIIALHSTVGRQKVEVMRERMLDISPECDIRIYPEFFSADNSDTFPFEEYDYVCDCIDSVKSKLELIRICSEKGIPVISAMGAGNKKDPTKLRIADIHSTRVCPLAKVIRTSLRKMGIDSLKCVYSEEEPAKTGENAGKRTPGSLAYMPSAMGLVIASEVINDLTK